MSNIIPAKDITLYDLEKRFNLRLTEDQQFFPEWQTEPPTSTTEEQKILDLAKAGYLNLTKYQVMLENTVQITVLSPLLLMANLLSSPFQIKTDIFKTKFRFDNQRWQLCIYQTYNR